MGRAVYTRLALEPSVSCHNLQAGQCSGAPDASGIAVIHLHTLSLLSILQGSKPAVHGSAVKAPSAMKAGLRKAPGPARKMQTIVVCVWMLFVSMAIGNHELGSTRLHMPILDRSQTVSTHHSEHTPLKYTM